MSGISDWIANKKKIYGELVKKSQCIECLLKELEIKAKNFHFENTDKTFQLRRTLDVHLPIKTEHLWERLITSIMPEDTFFNQFSFNKTNNIDMVKITEQKLICELIKLKTGSNEISHACYEILFYYLLLLRAKEEDKMIDRTYKIDDNITLIVLAPGYYLKTDYQNDFFKQFKKIVTKKYSIKFEFIPLPHSDKKCELKDMTDDLCNKISDGEIKSISQDLQDYFLKKL